MTREATVERNTKETEIKLKLDLDGTGYQTLKQEWDFLTICLTDLHVTDSLT